MSKLAVIATLVFMSNGVNAQDAAVATGGVQKASEQVLAFNSPSTSAVGDTTLQSAVDFLKEARKAVQVNERRNRMKPGIQDRVVKEKRKRDNDKVLIMGGKEAIPM